MPAADPPRRERGPAHRAVLAAFLALGIAAGSWGARIPDVKADLHLSEGALGTALLCLSVGAVAGAWIGGLAVRRHGSRLVVGVGWTALGVTIVGPGLAGSWAQLAAVAVVLGLAIGVLDVSMNGAGVQLENEADEPLLSGLHAGWSAGILLGAGLGALTVALDVPTAWHLAAVGVVVLAGAAMFVPQVPDGSLAAPGLADGIEPVDPTVPVSRPAVDRGADRRGRLAALAAICGFVFMAEGALLDWAGVLVREDLVGGALLGALAVTGVSAGGLAGRLVGDRLAARWGAARLVRRGVALAAISLAAVLVSPAAWPVPLLLVGVGAGLAPTVPLAFAAAGRRWSEHGIAVVTTAGYGCYLAGPGIIGGIAHATQLRLALVLPLLLVVAVAPLAWSTEDRPAASRPAAPSI